MVQNDQQFTFDGFDGGAVRRLDRVRVDVERRRNAGVPKLLLRDLDRHLEVVEQRRVNVSRSRQRSRDRLQSRPPPLEEGSLRPNRVPSHDVG